LEVVAVGETHFAVQTCIQEFNKTAFEIKAETKGKMKWSRGWKDIDALIS
jgi:hypothetical protein